MATQTSPAPALYDPRKESWKTYISRFRMFLEANNFHGLPDNRKRALFLTYCGPEIYSMAQALIAPMDIESSDWTLLQNKLEEHYQPSAPPMVSRNEFYHRKQREGESINDFVASLRQIATKCEFDNPEDMMKDRIILGMRDLVLQKKLLVKRGAMFKDVIEAARAAEASDTSAANVQKTGTAVHRTQHHTDWETEVPDTDEEENDDGNCRQIQDRRGYQRGGEQRILRCPSCLGNHPRAMCKFRDAICRRCQKRGHIAEACRASLPALCQDTQFQPRQSGGNWRQNRPGAQRGHRREENQQSSQRGIYHVVRHSTTDEDEKFFIQAHINGTPCRMEVDTGSTYTIMAWTKLKQLMPGITRQDLKPSEIRLRDYQQNKIPVLGKIDVPVEFKEFKGELTLTVVEGQRQTLLGVKWLKPMGIKMTGLHHLADAREDDLTQEFQDVFSNELGKYKGKPISFNLDPSITPIRLKPRRVPLPLLPKVDEQIDKLLAQGVLEPVDHATWETPIVTPRKPDGSVRLCADYRATINRALQPSAYPVPVVQQLLHSLGQGKFFAKLDLAQAYQQLPVDEKTAEAQTIVTHRGAFRCTRLQFGVSVAPGLFQSMMERLLHNIPGVMPYFDDVLISGSSRNQLMERVREVLKRFREKGLKVKKDKCKIGVPSVEFLGFRIDGTGIHPTEAKVKAIKEAPEPKNKTDLQAFLGLLNFYAIFLQQKATVAEPLHRLLGKEAAWKWGQREADAFKAVKELLSSDSLLIQYSTTLPIRLTCDASPFGVGAVLSHVFPNGSEAPIAFYSKTLSAAERNYSQLDKEALAAVAGIKRFHEYLYGRKFQLITDHKPLLGLIAGDRQTPQYMPPRMARWLIFLSGYDYKLYHTSGKDIGHADALSRCPLPELVKDPAPVTDVLLIDMEQTSPVTAKEIAEHTQKDHILARVMNWVMRGWPKETMEEQFRTFKSKQQELSVIKGCLLWGERVIVPQKLRKKVMTTLHKGHPGIVRMKALARSYLWWPQLDQDITEWVATCDPCQESRPAPPKTTPYEWETPRGPWTRVHIDFAGPIAGQSFLIVVDAYSKWLEVVPMTATTTSATIRALRRLFATHGLPDSIVSDNGPQLTAKQMELFLANLGIRHILVSPFCPASNGQAERMVRVTKEALAKTGPGDWQERIDQFLLTQHITPCATTNRSPAELLMGRKLRSTLDRLHPEYAQEDPTMPTPPERTLQVGEHVFARNYTDERKWEKATVIEITGPKSYKLRLEDGREWRRHIDQLRHRHEGARLRLPEPDTYREQVDCRSLPGGQSNNAEPAATDPEERTAARFQILPGATGVAAAGTSSQLGDHGGTELRKSNRRGQRPGYLQDYVTDFDSDWLSWT